jgi:hypothetical protein
VPNSIKASRDADGHRTVSNNDRQFQVAELAGQHSCLLSFGFDPQLLRLSRLPLWFGLKHSAP